jgi:ATP-binding cassette subfamily B protein
MFKGTVTVQGSSLYGIWALLRRYPVLLLLGAVCLVGGTVVNLALPALARDLLNRYGVAFVDQHLLGVGALLVVLFAMQGLFFYWRTYLFGYLGQRVARDLRGRLFESIIYQPIDFFDTSRTADLVSRLNADTLAIQDAVSIRLSVLVRYALQVLLGAAAMAFISSRLTCIVLLTLLFLVGISLLLGKRLRAISRAQQKALGAASVTAEESFGMARVVKAFNREADEIRRFEGSNLEVLSLGMARTRVSAFFQSFVTFLLHSALAILVLYGVVQVAKGELLAGDLTAFLAYGAIVAVSFSFIAGSYAELMQALGASERVFEIIARGVPPATRGEPVAAMASHSTELNFEGVSFAYPSRPANEVLRDLTFTLPQGKTVALVGPSGAGKSTVVNLLLRFYDPVQGGIKLGGVDLRDIPPADLRRRISFVPQEPELFGVSIAENLRYGRPAASADELSKVCARAGLDEFVAKLPQGLDTIVGERGAQLSGGQKQRIAIARAMLRDPQILLLDEATSALDSESEALVQRALAELLAGRTALIIAHRLSTIKGADTVLVLDKGQLVQSGTHEALSQIPGLYRTLVERQELLGAG